MVELPETPAPNGMQPTLLDFGITLRPSSGAAVQRIDRPGSRFRMEVSFPPMKADVARTFVNRLLKAKREGLRMEVPLLGVSQGNPGSPVVDGASQTGTAISLRGFNPHHAVKEGYWLTLVDAEGDYYLHQCTAPVFADATGDATLAIEPAIRAPLPDGATVLLAKPKMQGFIDGDVTWGMQLANLVDGVGFALEEAA